MSIKCVLLKKDIVYFSDHRKTDYWSKRQKTKTTTKQTKKNPAASVTTSFNETAQNIIKAAST